MMGIGKEESLLIVKLSETESSLRELHKTCSTRYFSFQEQTFPMEKRRVSLTFLCRRRELPPMGPSIRRPYKPTRNHFISH